MQASDFCLWAMGCAHVGTDLRVANRESLADAIAQTEQGGDQGRPAFDWDIALHLGDLSGNQQTPDDKEGQEVVRQFARAKIHKREDFYNLAGNHDATRPDEECQWWFKKWVDPEGANPQYSTVRADQRPYPITGNWERYSFRAGNLLILMMSDRNDGGPPVGRAAKGGYPAGAVTQDTFDWWKGMVEQNQDSIIISAHHHMLKETTVASGPWEGFVRDDSGGYKSHYHGYFPDGGPEGASYLYFLGDRPDAGAFEKYLADHEGAIDFWLGGHTHTNPDDTKGGRSHIEQKWGVTFVNVAALTSYHGQDNSFPMSRVFKFTEGSQEVEIDCYLHTGKYAPQGWYETASRKISCNKAFVGPKKD